MDDQNDNMDGLSVAAERPDAAPGPYDHPVRIGLHVAALLGVVGLLLYTCAWVPMHAGGF